MDDLFDLENTRQEQAPGTPVTQTAAAAPPETSVPEPPQEPPLPETPDSPLLPSQSGTSGVLREIRSLAAKPLPKLTRDEQEITTDAFGSTLRALRERNHLSIETLSQRTLISAAYIQALEEEDYKHLPPPVYVSAYIRRLGSLYGLTGQELSNLTEKVRSMTAYELPKELDKTTITYEEDEENDERLRRMFWGAAIVAAVLIAVAVSGIILWAAHPSHQGEVELPVVENDTGSFRISELIQRRAAVRLKMAVLSPDGANR